MRSRNVLAFAVSFLMAAAVLAQQPGTAGSKVVIVQPADLKWVDLDPVGAPGVKSADVWGDHTKGAFRGFIKFPAGFATPLHTHTNELEIVVLSGTFIHVPEGKPEIRLGPGSYFMQPGGNYRHTTNCDKASDCVFFAESNGKFDLKLVDAGKAPAKK